MEITSRDRQRGGEGDRRSAYSVLCPSVLLVRSYDVEESRQGIKRIGRMRRSIVSYREGEHASILLLLGWSEGGIA